MKLKNKKNALIIATAIIAFGAVVAMQYYEPGEQLPPETHSVELRADGFYPQDITINKGDTVTFSTTRGVHFWPASNLHPSHKIFPEFDPKEPIEPDKTWSFKFDKIGVWKYHDHLAPLYGGTVTVVKNSKISEKPPGAIKSADWSNEIQTAIATDGINAAFNKFSALYAQEPAFARDCHDYAHKLGEAAYDLLARNEKFKLIPETGYCAYGFYHGLMEKVIVKDGSSQKAGKFCDDNKAEITPILYDACYHGIGHGAMSYAVNDPKLWPFPQKLIDRALDLCPKISDSGEETLWKCASGVFMELGTYYMSGQYGLTLNKDNPFEICESQKDPVAVPCYTQMNGVIVGLAQNDLAAGLKYVEKITSEQGAKEAAQTLSASIIDINRADLSIYINSCRNGNPDIKDYCIRGLALGFMLRGEPGKEYEKAINFCNAGALRPDEARECFHLVLTHSQSVYSGATMADICNLVRGSEYSKPYCD